MINPFRAVKALYQWVATGIRSKLADALYPVIPATWPNRAVRRAVIYGRPVPNEWAMFFEKNPGLKRYIRTGVFTGHLA